MCILKVKKASDLFFVATHNQEVTIQEFFIHLYTTRFITFFVWSLSPIVLGVLVLPSATYCSHGDRYQFVGAKGVGLVRLVLPC